MTYERPFATEGELWDVGRSWRIPPTHADKEGAARLAIEYRADAAIGIVTCYLSVIDGVGSLRQSDFNMLARVWVSGANITMLRVTGDELSATMDNLLPVLINEFIADYREANPAPKRRRRP